MKFCVCTNLLFLSIALLTTLLERACGVNTLEFFIDEELALNTEIGNVKLAYFNSRGFDTKDKKLRLFQSTERHRGLFEVDENSGALRVKQRVDRDALCGKEPLCRITFTVLVPDSDESVDVHVNVLDVNDCTPSWPVGASFPVSFREDHPPGHSVPIPAAHDLDLGSNGSVRYQLSNPGAPFVLQPMQENGQVVLESSRMLDREQRSFYNMTLLAIDGGQPPRTGSLQLLVQVTDVNDNAPQFDRSLFVPNRLIYENEPVNSLILVLNASDADSDSYGQVVFKFAPDFTVGGLDRQKQQRFARQHFLVKADGRVTVKRPIDYDAMETKSIVFMVIARDNSQEVRDRRTSTATVSLSINDRDDEPPSVEVCSPSGQCPGIGEVTEGQAGARVAMVIVRDPDTRDRVDCRVIDSPTTSAESSIFELVSQSGTSEPRIAGKVNTWTYYLVTKSRQLDRERTPRTCFRIECRDSSNPVSSSPISPLCVNVADVNDNLPRLKAPAKEPVIDLNAVEEDSSRQSIGRLSDYLTDDDIGANARLSYSIDVQSTEPEAAAAFSIDNATGLVTPLVKLDRERRSHYLLKVRVSDHGQPALSVLVDVRVTVQDVNDHAPEFSPPDGCPAMRVVENRAPPALVGRVTAKDADYTAGGGEATGSGRVVYRLDRRGDARAFAVNPNTGEISTTLLLDRERQAHYSFSVLAVDKPQRGQQQLTGTCHVTVTIDDVNDNPPAMKISPPDYLAKFAVKQLEPGHRVGQVFAEDPDEGVNQKLVYQLLNSNESGHRFSVHNDTGSILVSRHLHDIRPRPSSSGAANDVRFRLRIRACDLGSPQLCSAPVDYHAVLANSPFLHGGDGGDRVGSNRRSNPNADHVDRNVGGSTGLLAFSSESLIICLALILLVLTFACFAVVCLIVRRRTSSIATPINLAATRRGVPPAAPAGDCVTGGAVDPDASELEADASRMKMLDSQGAYYCPPNYKNFKEEDYHGGYSSAQQLQLQRMQFNNKHATVARDCRYFSPSPSMGQLAERDAPLASSSAAVATLPRHQAAVDHQQQQQHYQTVDFSQAGGRHQSLSHHYYEIEGRGVGGAGLHRAVLSTPQQPRRQSDTLPTRSGYSVDGKSAAFPSKQLMQQQQQLQLQPMMHRRAPFSPYTEASFV